MVAKVLKDRVNARIAGLMEFSATELGILIPEPTITYRVRGTNAGVADFNSWSLHFNPTYLTRYADEFILDTVSHEVAHLIAAHKHGWQNIFPHGREWQATMRAFGLTPKISHCYK